MERGMAMVDYAEQRRQYVSQIRDSFDQREAEAAEPEPGTASWGMRLRFVVALALFLLFFYWYDADIVIQGCTAEKVMDLIEDNRYDTILQDYVMSEL